MACLKTLAEWIHNGGGAQDALDDVELHSAMRSFLSQQESREAVTTSDDADELSMLWKDLQTYRTSLFQTFNSQTLRPQTRHVPVRGSLSATAAHNFGLRPPRIDELTPEDLVNNLDAMAAAAFRNVVQEVSSSYFSCSDIIEREY